MNNHTLRSTINAGILIAALTLVAASASAGNWLTDTFGNSRGVRGSGDLVTEKREVASFSRIRTSGAYDVKVTVGEKQSIIITFDDNIIDLIQTDVRGKTLRIFSDDSYRSRKHCVIKITIPKLERVVLKGSGDIIITGFRGEFFEFELKGSGDMEIEGEVDELEISLSGSGNIDARDLVARDAIAVIRGSGDISVFATEVFDGTVYGSGDIDFYGRPGDVSRHVAGSGDITRRR